MVLEGIVSGLGSCENTDSESTSTRSAVLIDFRNNIVETRYPIRLVPYITNIPEQYLGFNWRFFIVSSLLTLGENLPH